MKKIICVAIFILLVFTSSAQGKRDFKPVAEKALIEVGINDMEVLNTTCKYFFESTTTLYILCKNDSGKRWFVVLRSNKNFFGANDPWYIIKIDSID